MNLIDTVQNPILITGGSGYIGSHIAWALMDLGHSCIVFDNLSNSSQKFLPPSVPCVVGDILDVNALKKTLKEFNIKHIIHCAGRIVVEESVTNPLFYFRENTFGTQTVLEAACEHGIESFIFSSSASVYGVAKEGFFVDENAPLNPLSPYGTSKMLSEKIIEDTAKAYGFSYAILRYFNVAGADPLQRSGPISSKTTNLIRNACKVATGQVKEMEVFGATYPTPDGTCLRDYIHVSDLADLHVEALSYLRKHQKSILMNCGYGQGYSVLEVLKTVQAVSKKEFPILIKDPRPGDPIGLIAKVDKLLSLFPHWNPRFNDLSHLIETALAWEEKCQNASF